MPAKKEYGNSFGRVESHIRVELLFNASVTGVDISISALARAQHLFNSFNLELKFLHAPADELPVADHAFDLVLSFGVLEHNPHPLKELREALRVLKPGGHAAFVVPNSLSIGPIDRFIQQKRGNWNFGHQREMSCRRLAHEAIWI